MEAHNETRKIVEENMKLDVHLEERMCTDMQKIEEKLSTLISTMQVSMKGAESKAAA